MLVEDLRAAVGVVGPAQAVGRRPTLEQHEPHAAPRQLGGQHQAGGPTADDRDIPDRVGPERQDHRDLHGA
jgi:hypothetical protein